MEVKQALNLLAVNDLVLLLILSIPFFKQKQYDFPIEVGLAGLLDN